MDPKHLDLVAWSLARMKVLADAPAKLFLSRLSDLDPTLLPLFGKIGAHDRRALARVQLLASAGFRNDRAPAVLRDFAERCKQRTIGYRDQAAIMSATLWTLQHVLGAGFTLADREAWIAYQQQLLRVLERAARAYRQQTCPATELTPGSEPPGSSVHCVAVAVRLRCDAHSIRSCCSCIFCRRSPTQQIVNRINALHP